MFRVENVHGGKFPGGQLSKADKCPSGTNIQGGQFTRVTDIQELSCQGSIVRGTDVRGTTMICTMITN